MGSNIRIALLVIVGAGLLALSRFMTSYDRQSMASIEQALGIALLILALLMVVVNAVKPQKPAKKDAAAGGDAPEKPAG